MTLLLSKSVSTLVRSPMQKFDNDLNTTKISFHFIIKCNTKKEKKRSYIKRKCSFSLKNTMQKWKKNAFRHINKNYNSMF